MSEHDRNLIEQAKSIDYIYHAEIDELIRKARSLEAQQSLREIQRTKEHREEYAADCI
jgi:hypothetical protein